MNVKVVTFSLMVGLIIGKAHALGAWFSMYLSNKLNYRYVLSMILIAILFAILFFGFIDSVSSVFFVAQIFFIFHFFFDEFDLQEEKRTTTKVFLVSVPTMLLLFFLIIDFFNINFIYNFEIFFVSLVMFSIISFFIKEINWFFTHVVILYLFIFFSLVYVHSASSILILFAVYHYFFWFVYPINKLYKNKKIEKLDSLINFLLIVLVFFLFFEIFNVYLSDDAIDFTMRLFSLGTVIHVLSTAPFGYLFGLPK